MHRLFYFVVFLALAVPGFAQSLGETTFPNSGSEEAQEPFMRGLLLLHSFEYDDARDAFQEAREIDPDFAMAYWGEALTHNHPIWQQQDRGAALAVLTNIPAEAREKVTGREEAYLATLDVLYGDGGKEDRDVAYAEIMGGLAAAYPDDLNAATFHALAILGTAHEGRNFEIYDRAGQIALAAFMRNPRHPGAAHYVIHSYDDPLNAEKALDAAQAYTEIAPDAPHALHMPTHIYFALGMWDEGAEMNRRSFEAARARDEAAGQPLGGHGWHPLYWLHYAELQRGRFEEARRLLNEALELAESGSTPRGWSSIVAMRANQVLDASWLDDVAELELPLNEVGNGMARRHKFIEGTVALLRRRELTETAVILAELQGEVGEIAQPDPVDLILVLMLDGLLNLNEGNIEVALEKLRDAASIEDQMPLDFGPPNTVKPARELLGEALYLLSRYEEAVAEFRMVLERTPRRRRALVMLAQAAQAAGEITLADEAYSELDEMLQDADESVRQGHLSRIVESSFGSEGTIKIISRLPIGDFH